jgi:hypothetical protein
MSFAKLKQRFYFFIHANYLLGLFYALTRFLSTPRTVFANRRLWAYEFWIILSFYLILFYLILIEKEKAASVFKRFQKILGANLLLLIFPWGLFLLLSPGDFLSFLGLNSIYWRILGFCSLIGALVYYFPYRFYKRKITYPILIFGIIDNLLAGTIVAGLFFTKRIPLLSFSAVPLLYYFSFFFLEQTRRYRRYALKQKSSN